MTEKKITIHNIGEAAMHIQALVLFFDRKPWKIWFRVTFGIFILGTTFGIRQCSVSETITTKEYKPQSAAFFVMSEAYAGIPAEMFRIDKAQNMYGYGQLIGKRDTTVECYKVLNSASIVVVDHIKNRVFQIDDVKSIK